jgi:anion-transporting  ArsA/GET3 family ATPase
MTAGPALEDLLAGTTICVCVGSGGVGKTTTSAAIAAGMAARGKRVAVLTIDPAKRLADSLGLAELANEETRVDPALFTAAGVDPGEGELWATMLDAKATFDEMVARYAPDREAEERILANRIYQEISSALAGSQEYMAMEKLYEIHEQGRYDLLVLDTPPSRNALDFLDAPQRLVQFIEGRSLRLFLRPAGIGARIAGGGASVVFSALSRLTGIDLMRDLSEFFGATRGMIGGFRERAERVSGLLASEGTRFVIVCGPAGDAVEEDAFLREKLRDGGLPLGAVVVNRVHGEDGASIDLAAAEAKLGELIEDPGLVERILAANASGHALAERDERSVASLADRIGDSPLIRVPELTDEVHDLAGLLGLDAYLFGR